MIKNKIYLIGSLDVIETIVPLAQLELPDYVMDFDFKVNGIPLGKDAAAADTASNTIKSSSEEPEEPEEPASTRESQASPQAIPQSNPQLWAYLTTQFFTHWKQSICDDKFF